MDEIYELYKGIGKLMEFDDLNMRKRYSLQDLKMPIVADDVVGIGNDGAVDKFVVVRVFLYQTKTVLGVKALTKRAPQYRIDDVLCDERCCLLPKDLQILADDLITDTNDISPFTERIPRWAVWTVQRNHLQEAVGINDNVVHLLTLFVWSAIMCILQVAKFLLVPCAVSPKLFHGLIGTLSEKLRDSVLQGSHLIIGLQPCHCIQQFYLCRRKGVSVFIHNAYYL